MKPSVSVIVVNYNTLSLTKMCLESIYRFTENITFEVMVVDNASRDNSADVLKKEFPGVTFILNKHNLGFAKANNQGIKVAKGEWIFLLNSDAYLIENSIKKLVTAIKDRGDVGAVSCRIQNSDGSLQQSLGFFPTIGRTISWMFFLDDLPLIGKLLRSFHIRENSFYTTQQSVDWVTGACFLAKKSVLKQAGLFDESIFMYGEDVELCYKIKQLGKSVLYLPVTKVVHLGSGGKKGFLERPLVGEILSLKHFYESYFPTKWFWERIILKIGLGARLVIFGLVFGKRDALKIYAKAFALV